MAAKSEKFRLALEQTPMAVFIMDNAWQFEYINPEFERLSGFKREELLNKSIGDTIYKDIKGIPESRLNIVEHLKSGKVWTGELLTTNRNGNNYWAETTASPYRDEKGVVQGYIVIQHDVTERKQMITKLKEREQLHETLMADSLEAVGIMQNFKFLYINKVFGEMFGYTIDELNAMDSTVLIAPEDRVRIAGYHQKRINGESSPSNYNGSYIRKDGTHFIADTNSSLIELNGKRASYVSMKDITEKVRMENALRDSEQKHRNLIEKATDGIVITQYGVLKFANQAMCDMMQMEQDEMIGKSFLDYVLPEHHQEMLDYHKRRMNGEVFNALYRSHFIRKDQQIITVELNARTLDYEGRPSAFIVIRDITDRLKIEEELLNAQKELETLNKHLEKRVQESSESLTEARTQLIRLQKENLQSQFEVLRQQVNPHFLFNSLNVLTSLIKLEPDLAEKFTEHLSKVYRYVLENKDNDLVDLKTELDFLNAYLFLLNIRFMDKIEVKIAIENDLSEWLILPLALQLLIENAIKHNAMSKRNPLRIQLFIDANHNLNVVNNLQERESYIASTGVGLKNIEHRYQLLEMPAPEFIKTNREFIARIPLKSTLTQTHFSTRNK